MLAQLLEFLGRGRIALLGFGREGRSSYAFLRGHFPDRPLLVADRAPIEIDDPHVSLLCGENHLDALRQCDILLKSPGVPLKGIPIPPGLAVTCQTDLFLRFAPCVKAGVTGSKGKTTTSTLLHDMLRASGLPARLIGNVGVPVLDCFGEIDGCIAVVELSSHQLEYTSASPHVAVWTNLYEEHLDHYTGGFTGYAAAKARICIHQAPEDIFIFNADQPLAEMVDLSACRAERVPVGLGAGEADPFLRSLECVNPRLRGDHNRHNIYFAATAALSLGATREGIRQAVADFQGIAHRMYPVSEAGGIHWVDNCISTIPQAVLCDVDALGDVDTLILGGLDRGIDYRGLAEGLTLRPVRNVICMPETGRNIAALLKEEGSEQNIVMARTMEEAVAAAFACTERGKTCLLAPAAASYNAYRDFEEKGKHFADCVNSTAAARSPCPG
ncbi:MAG: UDP-N-acetylmuramoyl-L-alanine--D-glutamate ligase [Oscillospiraceae bacterium]|jgi:UDP-N-acetylmuramoylalanine--D-glutamate ligase|nr:UDP-N-acetylmuramoyl-L-alanine--D-glutamate ligase [Oscillospiraceae bacterium]